MDRLAEKISLKEYKPKVKLPSFIDDLPKVTKNLVQDIESSYFNIAIRTNWLLNRSENIGIINVKDPPFDAKGDGVTDDTAAIQAAIDAIVSGGTIVFPEGTYKVTADLDADEDDVTFTSTGLATIKVVGAINGFYVTGARVTIEKLTITGDNSIASFGVNSSDVNTIVQNCYFSNFETHIKFTAANCSAINNMITQLSLIVGAGDMLSILVLNTNGAMIRGNRITLPVYESGTDYPIGINVGNAYATTKYNSVIDNKIYNGFDSISIRGAYVIVQANTCDKAYEAGILTAPDPSVTIKSVINGNILTDCGRYGIVTFADVYDLSITGNMLYNCGTLALGNDSAISINGQDSNTVGRFSVTANIIDGGKVGIWVINNTGYSLEHISLVGNTVANCTSAGMVVTRSDNVAVIGNNVYNCTTYGLHIASAESTGIVVNGNVLTGSGTNFEVAAGAGVIVGENVGTDETVTTGEVTLHHWGSSALDSSGGAITATLPDGTHIGQVKTIVMTDQTTLSTVAITHHDDVDGIPAYDGSVPSGDGEIGTFNLLDETWVLMWTGTEWTTLRATCTFEA